MWSHLYGYYEIRGAADYSITKDTLEVQAFLDGLPELNRTGLLSYGNAVGYPVINLSLVKSHRGNYAIYPDTWTAEINMMPVVCNKLDDGKVPNEQTRLLIKIAAALNWELIDEDGDTGEEYSVLYVPV
jgi:hypothetical protein